MADRERDAVVGRLVGRRGAEVLHLKDGTFTEPIVVGKLMNDSYSRQRAGPWACAHTCVRAWVLMFVREEEEGGGGAVATRSFAICRCACLKMHRSQLVKRPFTSVSGVKGVKRAKWGHGASEAALTSWASIFA